MNEDNANGHSQTFKPTEHQWLTLATQTLSPLYAQPHRSYHGIHHVHALLSLLDAHRHLVQDPLAVGLAIWFHDAIYDSTRKDNEEQSALLAEESLAAWGCPAALIDSVARKIRATHRHEWTDGDPDTAVFLDFDLGILAAPASAYEGYAAKIRQEYAWVPEAAYRAGRCAVLEGFLGRQAVYFTPALRHKWEAQARANLANERAQLGQTS